MLVHAEFFNLNSSLYLGCYSKKSFFNLGPINHIPPSAHIISSSVLVLEIICMLPDIKPQQWYQSLGPRASLIWSCSKFQSSICLVKHKPTPTTSLYSNSSF